MSDKSLLFSLFFDYLTSSIRKKQKRFMFVYFMITTNIKISIDFFRCILCSKSCSALTSFLIYSCDWVFIYLCVQQSAERCVSTLLDLIQTKVNYVVQEAIVVIRDIFRKYPNKSVHNSHLNYFYWYFSVLNEISFSCPLHYFDFIFSMSLSQCILGLSYL